MVCLRILHVSFCSFPSTTHTHPHARSTLVAQFLEFLIFTGTQPLLCAASAYSIFRPQATNRAHRFAAGSGIACNRLAGIVLSACRPYLPSAHLGLADCYQLFASSDRPTFRLVTPRPPRDTVSLVRQYLHSVVICFPIAFARSSDLL